MAERGTGKTHLFLRLKEEYRRRFPDSRHLPVFIDGRRIKQHILKSDDATVMLVLLYRELLDEIMNRLQPRLYSTESNDGGAVTHAAAHLGSSSD